MLVSVVVIYFTKEKPQGSCFTVFVVEGAIALITFQGLYDLFLLAVAECSRLQARSQSHNFRS